MDQGFSFGRLFGRMRGAIANICEIKSMEDAFIDFSS
jgi:hypothetical protein